MDEKYSPGSTNDVGSKVKAVGSSLSDLADTAKTQAARAVDDAQHMAKESYGDLEASIRRNPTQATWIAGGIGLLIGLILSR